MTGHPTVLAALLESKGLHRYGAFCFEYEKASRGVGIKRGGPPSRATFHRWLSGETKGVPYTDGCRVLEHMVPGYTAGQLFAPCVDGVVPAPARRPDEPEREPAAVAGAALPAGGLAGVSAVFASRSEFADAVKPGVLFDGARRIRAAGLSLNVICQQVAEQQLRQLISGGTELCCLFLDPDGEGIAAREREEGYTPGALTSLTRLNIDTMLRLRERLPEDARTRLQIARYDETIRFNLIFVDDHTCVAQPYLPTARGLESPTMMIRNSGEGGSLYPVFEQVYDALAKRSTYL
jgi:hypothetical protein